MFVNNRDLTTKILQLKALKRRVPYHHPARPQIEQDLNRRSAGLWGEREVDKKLKRIDQDKYYILSDLRLPNVDGTFFQIDTLILSKCFNLIIDSKNIHGTLHFDLLNHQFHRINSEGKIDVFSDPISQVRLHQQQLSLWFSRQKLPTSPIDFLVVSTNPNSIFHIMQPNHPYSRKICSLAGLTWQIDDLAVVYKKEMLTDKDLRKICKALLKANTPLQPSDILSHYGLNKSDLQTGVHCPGCEFLPLTYQVGKWYCPNCNKSFKNAHIAALDDYFLVFKPTITNTELREFLHISKPSITRRLVQGMNLNVTGKNKGTVYHRK